MEDVAARLIWRSRKIATFENKHGYTPDLEVPRKFSEKLLKRCLDDDDPYYRMYGVKLIAPYFLKSKNIKGLKFPERIKVSRHMKPSDFLDLPESFVIKSSFGSGLNEIVRQKSQLQIEAVCQRFNSKRDKIVNARGNTDPENCFIFEQFLPCTNLDTPDDYKFHCFHSDNGIFTFFLQLDGDRYGAHRQTMFDQSFNVIDMQFGVKPPHEHVPERPENFADLARIAEEISIGFDYVRVDLYNTIEGVFFGEIAPFHQGGMGAVSPTKWDDHLGALWDQKLPSLQSIKI